MTHELAIVGFSMMLGVGLAVAWSERRYLRAVGPLVAFGASSVLPLIWIF